MLIVGGSAPNNGHTTPGRARTREATIILAMLDPKNPIIRRLRKRGCKLSAHAYLSDGDRLAVSYIAFDPETKQKVEGRSKTGDWATALAELARQARVWMR